MGLLFLFFIYNESVMVKGKRVSGLVDSKTSLGVAARQRIPISGSNSAVQHAASHIHYTITQTDFMNVNKLFTEKRNLRSKLFHRRQWIFYMLRKTAIGGSFLFKEAVFKFGGASELSILSFVALLQTYCSCSVVFLQYQRVITVVLFVAVTSQ